MPKSSSAEKSRRFSVSWHGDGGSNLGLVVTNDGQTEAMPIIIRSGTKTCPVNWSADLLPGPNIRAALSSDLAGALLKSCRSSFSDLIFGVGSHELVCYIGEDQFDLRFEVSEDKQVLPARKPRTTKTKARTE